MASIGLLYVGAVLLLNGLALLGVMSLRAAAPLNLFVGTLQCLIPTVLMLQGANDPAVLLQASGLYLFGFTYLYVGIAGLIDLDPVGIGWFSLFVSLAAVAYAWVSFTILEDPQFGVLWLSWSMLWALYFTLFALRRKFIQTFTAWVTILLSVPACSLPAFTALVGYTPPAATAALSSVVLLALVGLAAALASRGSTDMTRATAHKEATHT